MSFNWTPDELDALVNEHRIVLFMKGTPEQPQCGFSNRAATVLNQLGEPFASVNVLADPRAIPSVCTGQTFQQCLKYTFTENSSADLILRSKCLNLENFSK